MSLEVTCLDCVFRRNNMRIYKICLSSHELFKIGRSPAVVNPDLKPFLNIHVNLHVKKKVHLKLYVNLQMVITFM